MHVIIRIKKIKIFEMVRNPNNHPPSKSVCLGLTPGRRQKVHRFLLLMLLKRKILIKSIFLRIFIDYASLKCYQFGERLYDKVEGIMHGQIMILWTFKRDPLYLGPFSFQYLWRSVHGWRTLSGLRHRRTLVECWTKWYVIQRDNWSMPNIWLFWHLLCLFYLHCP